MSRAGYHDDLDEWALIRWRGAVKAAIRGKRGQAFLREMLAALDAMPEKCLIASELVTEQGEVCAMGAVCMARGLDVRELDPDEPEDVAGVVGLSEAMVREIAYENDEGFCGAWREEETPERRWTRMRAWVAKQILSPAGPGAGGGT